VTRTPPVKAAPHAPLTTRVGPRILANYYL